MSEKDWVQLENYPSLIAAELAQYKLTQHGIDSVIFDDEVASLYMSALGGRQTQGSVQGFIRCAGSFEIRRRP